MAFDFQLQNPDGTPASPPTLASAVPSWRPGDVIPLGPPGKALRVSRYTTEGHVRFSVWDESGRAEAAVSVDEEEAQRLAAFLASPARQPSLLERLGL